MTDQPTAHNQLRAAAHAAARACAEANNPVTAEQIADAVVDRLLPMVSKGFARPPGKGTSNAPIKANQTQAIVEPWEAD